jgi:hypothetical protein
MSALDRLNIGTALVDAPLMPNRILTVLRVTAFKTI